MTAYYNEWDREKAAVLRELIAGGHIAPNDHRSPLEHERDARNCPLGDDCDLTLAWMKGQKEARDTFRARIEELKTQVGLARIDADQQRARAESAEAALARVEAETLERAADIVKHTPEWKFGNLWHRRDVENAIRALEPQHPAPGDQGGGRGRRKTRLKNCSGGQA
jgi:hypothetical protein